MTDSATTNTPPGARFLRLFGDVSAGEVRDVLLMFVNVFLLLVAYYILKTVREPLILATGGAELKSYAAGAQAARAAVLRAALRLAGVAPAACSRLVPWSPGVRRRASSCSSSPAWLGVPYVGFAFYIWVGIFSLTLIAQFWSFANDIYRKADGDRLFPLIAVGATAGAPLGAAVAPALFSRGVSPWAMMQIAAGLLLLHLALYHLRAGRGSSVATAPRRRRSLGERLRPGASTAATCG